MSGQKLCELAEVEDGGSAGFSIERDGVKRLVMAIRKGEAVYVYVNSCPHIGSPLDFHAGRFLSHDKKHILCSTHGALFEIEDGLCIFGPCRKTSLEAIPVTVSGGTVYLD